MSDENLDDMYRDIILDHYRSPRGKKPLKKSDIASEGMNPSCGDEINLEVEISDDNIKDVYVSCRGCAISVASGSMFAEISKGRSLEEVKRIAELVKKMLIGEEVEVPEEFEDLDALKGVRNFPVRVKCALLSWVTFLDGVKNYQEGKDQSKTNTEES